MAPKIVSPTISEPSWPRWRPAPSLVGLPVLFLLGAGAYHLWDRGWSFYAWWPMGLCLATAYILAWRWQKQIRAKQAQAEPSLHWTDRDRTAWKVVEARVKAGDQVFIPADVPHAPSNESGAPCTWIVVHSSGSDQDGLVMLPELDRLLAVKLERT